MRRSRWKSILKWFGLYTVAQTIGGVSAGLLELDKIQGGLISWIIMIVMILWHHRTRFYRAGFYLKRRLHPGVLTGLFAGLSFVMALVVVLMAREFGWRMSDKGAYLTVAAIWGVVGIAVWVDVNMFGTDARQPIIEAAPTPSAPRVSAAPGLAFRLGQAVARLKG